MKIILASFKASLIFSPLFSWQTPLEALQEQCNTTSATNSHVVLQLEHAQSLLAQFSESLAEISPWLGETQTVVGQLSMSTVSYEAFREQQDLLQVEENKPLPFFFLFLFGFTKKSLRFLQSVTRLIQKMIPIYAKVVNLVDVW